MPAVRRFAPEGRGWFALRIALALIGLVGLVVAIAMTAAHGPVRWSVGPLRISGEGPVRGLIVSAIATAMLLAISGPLGWPRRWSAVVLATAASVVVLARQSTTNWPGGDGALIELSVLEAIRGHQVLGAYSQYGWHHPGPIPFYWLAPFYWLSGETTYGLSFGVLLTNLAALAIVCVIVARRRDAPATLMLVLSGLLTLYVVRLPGLLISGWNPHTPVLPLLALLILSAAIAGGASTMGAVLLQLFLATFVVQAHVGFAIVAAGLVATSTLTLCWMAWWQPVTRRSLLSILNAALILMQLLWLLPIVDQISNTPGNMTRIVRFFLTENDGQPLGYAWRAWGTTLADIFRPELRLAVGVGFRMPDAIWPALLGTALYVGLVPTAIRARRAGRTFEAWLAIACVVASTAGLFSTLSVRGRLGDYHIFWLSIIGVVNAAVVVGAVFAALGNRLPQTLQWVGVRLGAAMVLVAATAIGMRPLLATAGELIPGTDNIEIKRLTEQIMAELPSSGFRRPVLRLGTNTLGVGAGLMLQMHRQGIPVSVAPEMIWLFGDSVALDGGEDELLIISRPRQHEELARRPGNRTFAATREYFVDGVSLVDTPAYRP